MLVFVPQMRVDMAGQYGMLALGTYKHTLAWEIHEWIHYGNINQLN
jgi:hypothetical protein